MSGHNLWASLHKLLVPDPDKWEKINVGNGALYISYVLLLLVTTTTTSNT